MDINHWLDYKFKAIASNTKATPLQLFKGYINQLYSFLHSAELEAKNLSNEQ